MNEKIPSVGSFYDDPSEGISIFFFIQAARNRL